jgi:HSP20 family protein
MNSCTTNRYLRPAATIIENKDGFLVEADLPGVNREGLQLTVEDDTLTILGKRNVSANDSRVLHRETSSADYRRAFELSRQIDRTKVEARFEQGVLRVFLPKAEALKPRRIEIAS